MYKRQNKAGENTPAASNINTDKQVIPPVEDGVDKQPANTVGFRDESLSLIHISSRKKVTEDNDKTDIFNRQWF